MINPTIIKELQHIVGKENVLYGTNELVAFSYDGQQKSAIPDAVVTISHVDEVKAVVKIASSHHIPLLVRGAGSGMTGGVVPEYGGIVLNMERMNRILRINSQDSIGYVQPGVITAEFQKEAARYGLFYPPEPASAEFSTIGGNVAESAGGLGCVKYGLTKHFIAGLRFVTVGGDEVATGVYSDYDAPFDAGALIVGSEGTLGIITEVALRLIPLPESRATVLALFKTLVDSAHASNRVLSSGVGPSVLEFMDSASIRVVCEYLKVDLPHETGALLLIELDGSKEEVNEGHAKLLEVLKNSDALEVRSAQDESERTQLWKLRKSISPAIALIAPIKFNEDISVPLSKIPDICAFVEELGRKHAVKVITFGHSGDGNIHVNFMAHWKEPDEIARAKQAIEDLFREVVRIGGTLSGEHGIGIAKRPYLNIALDDATIEFEKRIKHAFDPDTILNPGKIFPQ